MNIKLPEQIAPNSLKSESSPRILLFDLDYRGHHPGYLQHLIQYWLTQNLPGRLDVLVSRQFIEKHAGIVALAESDARVQFVAISAEEQQQLVESADLEHSFWRRIQRAFQEWRLLQKYTRRLNSSYCLIMYLDTLLLRFGLQFCLQFGLRFGLGSSSRLSCAFSCIYFRPVFHYEQFPNYQPTIKERLWQARDRFCLTQLLRCPDLQQLFCLDPLAVEAMNQLAPHLNGLAPGKARHLPDPVQATATLDQDAASLRAKLGVEPERQVFLLFGMLSQRKGVYQLLAAIEQIAPALCQRLCFLLIGPTDDPHLSAQVAQISMFRPVQIICQHNFLPDHEIQPYFELADVVLAPYQRHIGMSAILVRAAAAQTPVLSSDFGLMGEMTRRHQLGLAVDSADSEQLAAAIQVAMTQQLGDPQRMAEFAAENQPELFTDTIFQHIFRYLSTPV
ncbi:MAG: glycosyltransferase [Pegethrix bostrychoides GSE-TBD4-15B]|jgi:glycosyltransferase involved in cell wall biosynthesis|uniref:Glycosyltransferase n=1 Tax=Pegethrix bostrychoides GSE-TBD4-15B TaxID=2839662 RepID=A0A951U681_9CYAN|nr:glycosyltransferase [Pegethrix bostrychoides GSE-TBD4-15B]